MPVDPKAIGKIVSGPIRPNKVLAFKDRTMNFSTEDVPIDDYQVKPPMFD